MEAKWSRNEEPSTDFTKYTSQAERCGERRACTFRYATPPLFAKAREVNGFWVHAAVVPIVGR